MPRKSKSIVPSHLYCDNPYASWAMLTDDLLKAKPIQELHPPYRYFYLVCCVHKETLMQKQCLYNALKDYYQFIGEEKEDIDIQFEAGTCKKSHITSKKFVFPAKHLKEYGYTPQNANKLFRALIDKGFIRKFANNKRREQGFLKEVTIYEFVDDWKKYS